jgi:hypothetical protein
VFEFILHELANVCVQLSFYCLSLKTTLDGGETEKNGDGRGVKENNDEKEQEVW